MRFPRSVFFSALALTAIVGCQAKLESTVSLDGKPFRPTSCRSGQVAGFVGVDLVDDNNTKLRLVSLPSGHAEAHLFARGAATSAKLGDCGPITVNRQSSRINNIQNVAGSATLSCARAKGKVVFENCH